MGNPFSKKSAPAPTYTPPPPAAAKQKWRKDGCSVWGEQAVRDIEKKILEISTAIRDKQDVQKLRVLILGPTMAGKSSLINNINAAVTGNYSTLAVVSESEEQATRTYFEYEIEDDFNGDALSLPVHICDFRGFGSKAKGASLSSAKAAIEGKLKSGALVEPNTSDSDFASHDGSGHMAQMLFMVFDATALDEIVRKIQLGTIDGYLQAIMGVKEFALGLDIPIAVFLTKCDALDSKIKDNVMEMHFSDKVKDAVDSISSALGVSQNRVFPITNYTDQMDVSPDMAYQSLYAMKYILMDIYSQLKKKASLGR